MRYSSAVCFVFMILASSAGIGADDAWLEKSRAILDAPQERIGPSEEFSVEHIQTITDQYAQNLTQFSEIEPLPVKKPPERRQNGLLIFISLDIPEEQLEAILQEGALKQALFVLRGFPEGISNFSELAGRLNEVSAYVDPKPEIVLNPELFREYSITSAPTQVVVRADQILAKVTGDVHPDFILEKARELAEFKDFGVKGNQWEITEKDFVEEIKARMAQIDWQQKKTKALENYWRHYDFIEIPLAIETKEYTIDPSILVTRDIVYDDQVLARKGQKINPLKLVPFHTKLLIFDARDKKQQVWVKQRLRELEGEKVVLIVNQFNISERFNNLFELERRFNRPVYVLNETLYARLKVESIPSLIESEGDLLKVTQYSLD